MSEQRLGKAAWRLRVVVTVFAGVAAAAAVEARVTRIVIDSTTAVAGGAIPYQTLRGRAFGELDPNDAAQRASSPTSSSARTPTARSRYVTLVQLTKPVDMAQASGLMWHDVPNRGGSIIISASSATSATSACAAPGRATTPARTAGPDQSRDRHRRHWVQVPMARDRRPARHRARARPHRQPQRPDSQPLNVMGNPCPTCRRSLEHDRARC